MTALDTMTIIWGLNVSGSRRGNPNQPNLSEMRYRASVLLDMLDSERQAILLPTVALAEILVRVEEKMHEQFIAATQQKFFCAPFNLPASAIAARLWLSNHEAPTEDQISRTTLKADVQIIATAAAHGAKRFYSHDRKARKLAEMAGMKGLDLPLRHHDMHTDAELRREFFGDKPDQ